MSAPASGVGGAGSWQVFPVQTLPATQPALVAGSHVFRQEPPLALMLHWKPPHAVTPPVPLHAPDPLQVFPVTDPLSEPLHMLPHPVPDAANLHLLAPSHLPMVEHASAVVLSVQLSGSGMSFGTLVHRPAAFAQVWHSPHAVTLQQVLSTQWSEAHSESPVQLAPSVFLPQLPPLQALPGAQSASLVQVILHMFVVESQR